MRARVRARVRARDRARAGPLALNPHPKQVNVHLGDLTLNQHHMTLLEPALASHPGMAYLA